MITTVNISGTWSEKQKANNGLLEVANYINNNRIARVPIVGYVEFHQITEKLTGDVLTVIFKAVEPGLATDGTDPDDIGRQIWALLDELRKGKKKGAVEDTLFSVPRDGFDFDGPGGGGDGDGDGEMSGQGELPLDEAAEPEKRLGPDGEHEVPPPSGEEILAERAEAAEASGVPAATFSGGES